MAQGSDGGVDSFLAALDGIGWFEALPARARQDVRTRCERAVASGEPVWTGLIAPWLDLAGAYDEGSYASMLREYIDAAWGLLDGATVDERREDGEDEPELRAALTIDGQELTAEFVQERTWFDEEALALPDRALALRGHALRFLPYGEALDATRPTILTTKPLLARAIAERLLPPNAVPAESE